MKTQYDYRDIEAQKEEKEIQRIALQKNNEELYFQICDRSPVNFDTSYVKKTLCFRY